MNKLEKLVGNIIAACLILVVIFSILYSLFILIFRDGKGLSMYGSRGEFFMAE
jgi:ABC-type lipoprotein release transport system permease subunit